MRGPHGLRQPSPPLHVDGYLVRPVGGGHVQGGERRAADDTVDLQTVALLEPPDGGLQRHVEGVARARRGVHVARGLKSCAQVSDPRAGLAGFDRLSGRHLGPAPALRHAPVSRQRLPKRRVAWLTRKQFREARANAPRRDRLIRDAGEIRPASGGEPLGVYGLGIEPPGEAVRRAQQVRVGQQEFQVHELSHVRRPRGGAQTRGRKPAFRCREMVVRGPEPFPAHGADVRQKRVGQNGRPGTGDPHGVEPAALVQVLKRRLRVNEPAGGLDRMPGGGGLHPGPQKLGDGTKQIAGVLPPGTGSDVIRDAPRSRGGTDKQQRREQRQYGDLPRHAGGPPVPARSPGTQHE